MDKPGMLNVHQYLAIRVAHENDESKRSIARLLHHSQRTVMNARQSSFGSTNVREREEASKA